MIETSDPTVFSRELDISFDKMARILPDMMQKAMNVGAFILKEKVKSAFASKVPAATRPIRPQLINGTYQTTGGDTMVDAVRQGRFNKTTYSTVVHVLGGREKGSGQFIARFYEHGTKDRYAKKLKGAPLKRKRFTGRIKAYNYFIPTVESNMSLAAEAITNVIDNKLNEILNNG